MVDADGGSLYRQTEGWRLFVAQSSILGQEVLKIHAHINNPVSASNLCESLKFSR